MNKLFIVFVFIKIIISLETIENFLKLEKEIENHFLGNND